MFAPCLLGCRGTARSRPVPDGTGSRGLPYSPAGASIIRHQEVFSNTLSSGLLIRGVQSLAAHSFRTGVLPVQVIIMCPLYPDFLPMLAPSLPAGRMLGPGRLAHLGAIGLDKLIGPIRRQLPSVIAMGSPRSTRGTCQVYLRPGQRVSGRRECGHTRAGCQPGWHLLVRPYR
jgi:hypothetical protein